MLKRFDSVTNQAELNRLAAVARASGDVESYDALVKKENEVAHAQAQLVLEIQVSEENTNKEIHEAATRKLVAERRAQELRDQIKAKKLAKASSTAEGYRSFLNRVGSLYNELAVRKAVLSQISTYSPQDLRHATLDVAYGYVHDWAQFGDEVQQSLKELAIQGRGLSASGADATDLSDLQSAFDDVQTLYTQVVADVAREHSRRENNADTVADFLRSQGQLVHWCRSQKNALESVEDPDQVQELCTSFQNNISVMETNLLVLLELSEPFAPNPQVTQALIEVNEVWLNLAVYAFERMRDTLMEQHAQSAVEVAAKRWLTEVNDPLRKFLEEAKALLQMPSDKESEAVARPALEKCSALLDDWNPHAVILEHLSDFNVREECLKEHYAAIRRAVFAKLTLLTQSFHGQVQYPRRQEYTDRLGELTDWVQCKSQSGAWRQLLSRVEKMRQLIEENESLHGTAEERGSNSTA